MAQKNRDYWEERQVKREAKAFSTIQDIEKKYKIALEKAKQNINKELSRIGTTYMKDNNLSYHDALKLLKGDEYKVWKKDLQDYMKKYNKLLKTSPLEAKKLFLEIETLSARSRMSHLDSLRTQINMELIKVSSDVESATKNTLSSIYRDTYTEVTKDLGINAIVSPEKIKTVLDRPWSGANFSERLWTNTDKLARTVKQEIVNGMIQGINLQTMTKRVSERFETAKKNDVERLLRTEVNYTLNQATLDGYKEAGIEKYEFSATLDSRTSQICSELHGEIFEIKKIAVGLNYPPMHPRCRSTTIPIIDYENLIKQGREEIGDNENAKEVVRTISDELERGLPRITKQKEEVTRENEDITIFKAKGTKNNIYMEEKTKNSLMLDGFKNRISVKKATGYIDDTLSKAFETMGMKESDFGNLKIIIMSKENKFASYSPKTNIIYINPLFLGSEKVYQNAFNMGMLGKLTNSDNILSTYVHELTHAYENVYYKKFYKNDDILKIKKDNLIKIIDFIKENNYNIEKELSLYAFEQKDDISELLAEAYTRKKLGKRNRLIDFILDLYGLGDE